MILALRLLDKHHPGVPPKGDAVVVGSYSMVSRNWSSIRNCLQYETSIYYIIPLDILLVIPTSRQSSGSNVGLSNLPVGKRASETVLLHKVPSY